MAKKLIALRREEAKLGTRYEKGCALLRKMLRTKGMVPETATPEGGEREVSTGDTAENEPKPRKVRTNTPGDTSSGT